MSREIYGVVQYMVDKNTWKVVPLYTEDNKFVTLWFGGGYTDTVLKDNSYRLDLLEAIALNRTLAYDDEEKPDWRVIHLGTVKYLACTMPEYKELATKMENIAEFAGIWATLDQIRFVYYYSY